MCCLQGDPWVWTDVATDLCVKNTTDITAALEVDVLILSFRLDIRSLLRRMIGGERTLSLLSTAELGSNAPDVFSYLDNRLLLRGATLAGNSGDIVGSES